MILHYHTTLIVKILNRYLYRITLHMTLHGIIIYYIVIKVTVYDTYFVANYIICFLANLI